MARLFTDKVKDFIGINNMLDDGAHVIVGLSGGADSTALLLVLLRLGYKCTAVHCNFHLRGPESDRDQDFVTGLCKKNGVELTVCNYDTLSYAKQKGISVEMAARELRYTESGGLSYRHRPPQGVGHYPCAPLAFVRLRHH